MEALVRVIMKYREISGKGLRCFLTLLEDRDIFIYTKTLPNIHKEDRSYKDLGKITIKESK